MIQLRLLGSTELVGHGGESLLSVLSQPKRLTLLAYLALTATGGFTRRDKLIGLFWPESESDKARGALRRSLSFLKASLGEGVVLTRGDGEVGIAADALECDAVQFEAALDRSELQSALQHYRGTLLDAVFVSDAPELERWLEDERIRLRRRAAGAAAELADQSERMGDLSAAMDWARTALALEPHSEPGICRLIGLLDRAGDREGAVRTYDEFAARLAEEYDLEPSAETQAVIQAVRTASRVATSTVEGPAQARAVPDVPEAPRARTAVATPQYPRRLYAATLSIAALIIVLALWGSLRPEPPVPVVRYSMVFPAGEAMLPTAGRRFALSPDGTILVYAGGPRGRLLVRRRDLLHAQELPGTDGARSPFFSPDGRRVGFFAQGKLHIVSLQGGPATAITDALDGTLGAAWGLDDFVYAHGRGFTGLSRVRPEPGAVPQLFTQLDSLNDESDHKYPDVLSNGKGVVFTISKGSVTGSTQSIGVADLETGAHKQLVDGLYARYVSSGHLLWVAQDSALMVAPFDPVALEITGPGVVVSQKQRVGFRGAVDLAVSANGTLVYATGPGEGLRELVWVSRDGSVEPFDTAWRGGFGFPTLSPDGSRLAVTMTSADGTDVWVRRMDDGATLKLSTEGTTNGYPSWTPDGRAVTYFSNAGGPAELWTKPADGSAHAFLQLSRPHDLAESFWSPDGQWLIYRTSNVPRAVPGSPSAGAADILAIRPGPGQEPFPLATTDFTEVCPTLSPDGRFLAYASQETGKEEVFVVPFPNTGDAKWSISPDGGAEPVWSRNGGELFYRDHRGSMRVVEVQTSPTFSIGRNTVLFDGRGFVGSGLHPMYDVSMDDQRLLMVRAAGERDPGELIVVENWFQELRGLPRAR